MTVVQHNYSMQRTALRAAADAGVGRHKNDFHKDSDFQWSASAPEFTFEQDDKI